MDFLVAGISQSDMRTPLKDKGIDYLIEKIKAFSQLASTDQEISILSDLLIKYASDKREGLDKTLDDIARNHFGRTETCHAFVNDLSNSRHRNLAVALQRVSIVLDRYGKNLAEGSCLRKTLVQNYLPWILDTQQHKLIDQSETSQLFEDHILFLFDKQNRASWSNLMELLSNWETSHPARALVLHLWLFSKKMESVRPQLIEFISKIDNMLATESIAALKFFTLLLKSDVAEAIEPSLNMLAKSCRTNDPKFGRDCTELIGALKSRKEYLGLIKERLDSLTDHDPASTEGPSSPVRQKNPSNNKANEPLLEWLIRILFGKKYSEQ